MKFEIKRLGHGYIVTDFYEDDTEQQYPFTTIGDLMEWLKVQIEHEPDEKEE
jgi:hypothetical protein